MSHLIEFQKVLMRTDVRKKRLIQIRMSFENQQKSKRPLFRLLRCIRYFELPFEKDYFEKLEAELVQHAKTKSDELVGLWKREFDEKISPVKASLNNTSELNFEKYRDAKIKTYLYQNEKEFGGELYKTILSKGINDLIDGAKITNPDQLARALGAKPIGDIDMRRYVNGILIYLEGEAAKSYMKYEEDMLSGNAKWRSRNYYYAIWAVNYVHQKFYKKSLELK